MLSGLDQLLMSEDHEENMYAAIYGTDTHNGDGPADEAWAMSIPVTAQAPEAQAFARQPVQQDCPFSQHQIAAYPACHVQPADVGHAQPYLPTVHASHGKQAVRLRRGRKPAPKVVPVDELESKLQLIQSEFKALKKHNESLQVCLAQAHHARDWYHSDDDDNAWSTGSGPWAARLHAPPSGQLMWLDGL